MPDRPFVTVGSYIDRLNEVLASQRARIKGEVGKVNFSGVGVYFTLKDQDQKAVLECLIWLSVYQANGLELKEGDEIIVTGAPNVYAPFGQFKFKVNTLEYAGEGALKKAYDKLKADLDREGLLAVERKRPLPRFPAKIGVITPKSGVVQHDFSSNLTPHGYKISVISSRVEGKDAIHDLGSALATMAKQDIEILVIIRGGGSWESLQAFNTESIVRAIAGFKVPVLTGIGHDVDQTLTELVADLGASTPTAAAKVLNEPWEGMLASVGHLERRVFSLFHSMLTIRQNLVDRAQANVVRHYERRLFHVRSDLADSSKLLETMFYTLSKPVRDASKVLMHARGIMRSNIRSLKAEISVSFRNILSLQRQSINRTAQFITLQQKAVVSNDPKRNMALGYSLSYAGGKLMRSVAGISQGDAVKTQLADGEFTSEVKEVK